MPVPAIHCTAANCIPDRPVHVRHQFDLLMDAARAVCADFVGDIRGDGCWVFVPAARAGAGSNRNLLTVDAGNQALRLRIVQGEPVADRFEPFEAADLHTYQQRMATLYQAMLDL